MSAPSGRNSAVLLVIFFCLVTALTVAGFLIRPWLPPVASQHGEGVDRVIHYLLITTGAVFVLGHGVLAWLVWRHSGSGPATFRPISRRTEWLWALVPVAVMAIVSEAGVLVIGAPVWDQLYGETPADAVQVEVVGKQFEWIIRYAGDDNKLGKTRPELVDETNMLGLDDDDPAAADDIIVRDVLRLPVDRAVSVRLRSHDVLHSFAIPACRVKQDVVPGFTIHTQFKPIKAGKYEIACAELCGLGHYRMRGELHVLTALEFDKWHEEQMRLLR